MGPWLAEVWLGEKGQEGKREGIERKTVTLQLEPCWQSRNDRLRRGSGMLFFSTLITVILRRLESKPSILSVENRVFGASADKDIGELAVTAPSLPHAGRAA